MVFIVTIISISTIKVVLSFALIKDDMVMFDSAVVELSIYGSLDRYVRIMDIGCVLVLVLLGGRLVIDS